MAKPKNTTGVAIVVGGGGSIGGAIGVQLAQHGYVVMLVDNRKAEAQAVAEQIRQTGGNAHVFVGDIRVRDDMQQVVQETLSRCGKISVLVNAAGGYANLGFSVRPFHQTPPEIWEEVMGVNFIGVLNSVYGVIPHMLEQRSGVIINISSGHGLRGAPKGVPTMALYAAAKASIIAFSRAIAVELGPFGIRVNCVAPGRVMSSWKGLNDDDSRRTSEDIPLRKLATPEDVAHAVAFLASDQSSHITGACLDISGGTTLH